MMVLGSLVEMVMVSLVNSYCLIVFSCRCFSCLPIYFSTMACHVDCNPLFILTDRIDDSVVTHPELKLAFPLTFEWLWGNKLKVL